MVSKSSILSFLLCIFGANAFSISKYDRRNFISNIASASAAVVGVGTIGASPAFAGPEILNLNSGIKYAITKPSEKGQYPSQGDIVAVEYTGYLTSGQIFDATHAEGKKNLLLFKVGSSVVIPGINEVLLNMRVGEKVQAIIPPSMAFGDDGICLEDGECLVKPGSTLVYDILLKKSSIPPP